MRVPGSRQHDDAAQVAVEAGAPANCGATHTHAGLVDAAVQQVGRMARRAWSRTCLKAATSSAVSQSCADRDRTWQVAQRRGTSQARTMSARKRGKPTAVASAGGGASGSNGGGTKAGTAATATAGDEMATPATLLGLRADAVVGAAVFMVTWGLYLTTLYPSVPGGDSGELLGEACHLGVAHPPGYPLFVLVTRAWMDATAALGFPGSPAMRANAMSALFDAVAAVLIYHSVVMLTEARHRNCHWPAFTAGCMFALSPLIWLYAVGAEVFSMNNMLTAMLVHRTILYARRKSDSDLYMGAFLCGVALCNQHTAVLFEAPLIGWILWTQRLSLSAGKFLKLFVVGLIGLTPYVFLWYSDTYTRRPGSWGDASTLHGFLRHFLRQDYGTFRLYAKSTDAPGVLERTFYYVRDFLTKEAPYGIGALAFVGIFAATRRLPLSYAPDVQSASTVARTAGGGSTQAGKSPSTGAPANGQATAAPAVADADTSTVAPALLGTLAFYLFVFHFLSNMPLDEALLYGVHERFWQQPGVLTFTFLGVGLSLLTQRLERIVDKTKMSSSQPKRRGRSKPSVVGVTYDEKPASSRATGIVAAVCIAMVGIQVMSALPKADQSGNDYMDRYERALMDPMPPNSVFISGFDMQWAGGRYLTICEGYRPDITLLNAPVMSYDWTEFHREGYDTVKWPGKFLAPPSSNDYKLRGAFSLSEFLDANIDDRPIFIAGKYLGEDDNMEPENFVFDPWGIVSRVRRRTPDSDDHGSDLSSEQVEEFVQAHEAVKRALPVLPDEVRYDNSTWESTVRVDTTEKFHAYGEWLLDVAISGSETPNVTRALFAARVLEQVLEVKGPSTSLYKNLGLAYARTIQSGQPVPTNIELPEWEETRGVNDGSMSRDEWKGQASIRVLDMWTKFVLRPDAKDDASYPSIASVVQTLRAAGGKKK